MPDHSFEKGSGTLGHRNRGNVPGGSYSNQVLSTEHTANQLCSNVFRQVVCILRVGNLVTGPGQATAIAIDTLALC